MSKSAENSPSNSPKLNTVGSAQTTQGKNILNDADIIQCEEGYIFNPYNP